MEVALTPPELVRLITIVVRSIAQTHLQVRPQQEEVAIVIVHHHVLLQHTVEAEVAILTVHLHRLMIVVAEVLLPPHRQVPVVRQAVAHHPVVVLHLLLLDQVLHRVVAEEDNIFIPISNLIKTNYTTIVI